MNNAYRINYSQLMTTISIFNKFHKNGWFVSNLFVQNFKLLQLNLEERNKCFYIFFSRELVIYVMKEKCVDIE